MHVPAQFVTQCITNRERQVKRLHVAQAGGINPFAILCSRQRRLAIRNSVNFQSAKPLRSNTTPKSLSASLPGS